MSTTLIVERAAPNGGTYRGGRGCGRIVLCDRCRKSRVCAVALAYFAPASDRTVEDRLSHLCDRCGAKAHDWLRA